MSLAHVGRRKKRTQKSNLHAFFSLARCYYEISAAFGNPFSSSCVCVCGNKERLTCEVVGSVFLSPNERTNNGIPVWSGCKFARSGARNANT